MLRTHEDKKAVRCGAQSRRTESTKHKVPGRTVVGHYLGKVRDHEMMQQLDDERTSPSAAKAAMGRKEGPTRRVKRRRSGACALGSGSEHQIRQKLRHVSEISLLRSVSVPRRSAAPDRRQVAGKGTTRPWSGVKARQKDLLVGGDAPKAARKLTQNAKRVPRI